MCLSVYIATPKEVETSKFIPDETYFYCEKENKVEQLRDKFRYKNIYYCGAHTSCSCGFFYDFKDEEDESDKNENLWGKKSLEEMFDFFRRYIPIYKEIEMFICWEGDEDERPTKSRIIELSKFQFADEFHFDELEYIKIIE